MKKFLSLALALVMVFSLVLSASAKTINEFADIDSGNSSNDAVNDYLDDGDYFREALQMAVDLGILVGDSSNKLNPTGLVTRAEFYTMLYKFMNGGQSAPSTFADHPFTDVTGTYAWAASYVGWANAAKLTAGTKTPSSPTAKDGLFSPGLNISHSQALRAILSALGITDQYNEVEAATWQSQTMLISNEASINLVRDFSPADLSKLTRAECAVLLYFALDSKMQSYERIGVGNDIRFFRKDVDSTTQTAAQRYFGYTKVEGQIVANEKFAVSGSPASAGKIRLAGAATEYPINAATELVGRNVYFYTNAAGTKAYGTPNVQDTQKTYTAADVTLDGTNKHFVKASDSSALTFDIDAGATAPKVYKNYIEIGTYDAATLATFYDAASFNGTGARRGNNIRFVDGNDDGKYDYVFIEDYTVAEVTKIANKKVTAGSYMSGIATEKLVGDAIAEKDIIAVAPIGASGYYNIKKATLLEGKVSSAKSDGTVFVINNKNYTNYFLSGATKYEAKKETLNVDFNFYVLGTKIVKATSVASIAPTVTNYALITEAEKSMSNYKVNVYSALDPKGHLYEVSSSSEGFNENDGDAEDFMAASDLVGTVRPYKIASDGKIVFTGILDTSTDYYTNGAAVNLSKYDATPAMTLPNATQYYISSNTTFFFVEKTGATFDKVTVLVGRPGSFQAVAGVAANVIEAWHTSSSDDKVTGLDVLKAAILPKTTATADDNFKYVWLTSDAEFDGSVVSFDYFDGTTVKSGTDGFKSKADATTVNGADADFSNTGIDAGTFVKISEDNADIFVGAGQAFTASPNTEAAFTAAAEGYYGGLSISTFNSTDIALNVGATVVYRGLFSKVKNIHVINASDEDNIEYTKITAAADMPFETTLYDYEVYASKDGGNIVTDLWIYITSK